MANEKQQKMANQATDFPDMSWWLRNKSEKTLLDAENKTTK